MADGPEGVLLVDKPAGPTSHDQVAAVRRALGARRVGHAGTLDPFATGLLLVLVGRATRLAEFASALDKTYRASLRLGATSTTDDPEGEVVERTEGALPAAADVRAALAALVGEIDQVPPRYSAKRVGGERAYRMARGGAAFTLEARRVRVHAAELLDYRPPRAELILRTGPGVYVRSIARDLGEVLGVGGYLTALRREAVGGFSVAEAVEVAGRGRSDLVSRLLAPEAVLAHLPEVSIDAADARAFVQGRSFAAPPAPGGDLRVAGPTGFLGVGRVEADRLRARKVLHAERADG